MGPSSRPTKSTDKAPRGVPSLLIGASAIIFTSGATAPFHTQ